MNDKIKILLKEKILKEKTYLKLRRLYFCVLLFIKNTKRIEYSIKKNVRIQKGEFSGARCFIIGGAPSLKAMDLEVLNDEYTFVCNRGYLLKKLGLSKVKFYGISDNQAMLDYGKLIPRGYYEEFFLFRDIVPSKNLRNISYFSMYTKRSKKSMFNNFFQFDLSKPIAHSYTIVLQLLQIAVWLGFKEIYFIGVDNNFKETVNSNMHWYRDTLQEKTNIQFWDHDPAEDNSRAFSYAYKILQKKGISIYNAGVGGNLNSIPRVCFQDLFKKEKINK
ncbi:hypothetical protein PM10SUCC1_23090 [Propionigenium maris DSM 9537]|uniref:DUF115 domain-containing protein n=1 Tax=Propionigenium maris DSM 9537 TaxID=1123000 RepID=A0A9W6LPC3_9FUSO|nr:hypothetical protein [Propionigenium maris]GLI56795.1 hypothetical protein PM10SUCC1_23090 [Propionigenium maris DSM 9537]